MRSYANGAVRQLPTPSRTPSPRNVGRMSTWPARVDVREVGPRDGLQNEAPVPVEQRVRLIDALSADGAALHRGRVVRLAHGDPADGGCARGDGGHHAAPGSRLLRARAEPEGRRAGNGRGRGRDSSSSSARARRTTRRTCAARWPTRSWPRVDVVEIGHAAGIAVEAIVSTAFGCPYEGDVAPERVAQIAGHLVDAGADRLSFGDTTGMATPRRVDDLLDALARRGHHERSDRLALPRHARHRPRQCRRRARPRRHALRRARSAASAAAPTRPARRETRSRRIWCTCSNDMEIETGIDLDALLECARLAQEIVGRELPSALLHAGARTRRYAS